MGDATLQPSSGDDLVLSNDDGSAKVEVNEDGTVVITGLGATSFNDSNISNVGDISVDTISSDDGTSIGVTLGTDAGDDFNVGSGKLVVEGDTGNVGIGIDAPIADLQVSDSGATEVRLQMTNSNTGQGVGDGFAIVLEAGASNVYFWNYEARNMVFSPDGSNQFKIASDGKLFSLPTANNTSHGGANIYMIPGTGEFHLSTSSRRYKTNIVDTKKGLKELLTLKPRDFNSTCESDDPKRLRSGFIAEEVEEAGFIEYTDVNSNDEVELVEYAHMVTLCVKAIQELSTKVTALEKT
tara:strand:- start:571 stop:1458 length:888 start_codon:yes stop_codon:yes gene_type:complete